MERFGKNYEDVFSSVRSLKKCPLGDIEISRFGLDEYQKLYQKFLVDSFRDLFLMIVRHVWLRRNFGRKGVFMAKGRSNNNPIDTAYSIFIRHYVGRDFRMLTRWFLYNRIESYFDDFFPEFMSRNPFEDPDYYRLPYDHVSIDHLAAVYQMPERLDLLKEANEKKMVITVFFDYVVNYVLSYNEAHGVDKYIVMIPDSGCPLYIKNMDLPKNKPRKLNRLKKIK